MGELRLDHVAVRPGAELMAQDIIVVLNNPRIVEEWLAWRQEQNDRQLYGGGH